MTTEGFPPPDAPKPQNKLKIDPMDNLIIGSQLIRQYLGIRAMATFIEWVEVYGFPAIKRPDGQWMTTMSAIDEWIFLAAEADYMNRPHSRGDNKRADLALIKATRRVERMKAAGGTLPQHRTIELADIHGTGQSNKKQSS